MAAGPSDAVPTAPKGPYDQRLGYSSAPELLDRLQKAGFRIESQARSSAELLDWSEKGVFPVYHEKTQAGLELNDAAGDQIFSARYPERTYDSFDDIPRLVVDSLRFIENREILNPDRPRKNPAVEWDRLTRAVFDLGLSRVLPNHSRTGGSTLATQLEKLRHSKDGLTAGVSDKVRQMAAACCALTLAEKRRSRRRSESFSITSTRSPWPGSLSTVKCADLAMDSGPGSTRTSTKPTTY